MSILIVNGIVVTSNETYKAEIGILGEKIVEIAQNIDRNKYDRIIDANGNYIMPGFIDPHVHIKLPMRGTYSNDDFSSATRAAAAGGVTTLIDFATQMGDQSLENAINERKKEAEGNVHIDYGLHGGITNWKFVKNEMSKILEEGITSFKMFMAYKERGLFSSNRDILDAINYTKDKGGMILLHAESEEILGPLMEEYDTKEKKAKYGIKAHLLSRPPKTEFVAIKEAIELAAKCGGNIYIVHMSTGVGADYVRDGRKAGVSVIGETCPQYLLFNDEIFSQANGHYFATAPQIKSEQDRERLWEALSNEEIQVIGTDSVVFGKSQKDDWEGDFTKIPLGLPGTELMASLIYSEGVVKNKISINQFISLLSTNAAKVYGLYPTKGEIGVDSDADIVIFDPEKEVIVNFDDLETNIDWYPYQNWKLKGVPLMTILRGDIIAENGKFLVKKPRGKFIKRKASGNFL